MRAIWKFVLPVQDIIEVEMPIGAEVLTVQMQGNSACLWAVVDTSKNRETRKFKMAGTSHPLKEDVGDYIGTVQVHNGSLIFHYFEIP